MINGVGSPQNGRTDAPRATAVQRGTPVAPAGLVARAPTNTAPHRAADLAALGAPIDSEKVEAIRTAIARGGYGIDALKIAQAMITLDMPKKG
jgi:flagellar biosynthesis anti-sigma factor FlgM